MEMRKDDAIRKLLDLIEADDLVGVEREVHARPGLLNEVLIADGRKSALIVAIQKGKQEVATFLLNEGASLDVQDEFGWTALMFAARFDMPSLAQALIKKGAKLNLRNKDGFTALMFACDYCQPETAMLMLQNEAKVDLVNNNGFSALMLACQEPEPHHSAEGLLQCIKLCWAAGASLEFRTKKTRRNALELARFWFRQDAIKFLEFVRNSTLGKMLLHDVKAPRNVVLAFFESEKLTPEDCQGMNDHDLNELGMSITLVRSKFFKKLESLLSRKSEGDSLPKRLSKRMSGVFSRAPQAKEDEDEEKISQLPFPISM